MTDAELNERLELCIERTGRAILSLRHMLHDLSPANDGQRLRPCRCGRQWTRQEFCAVCAGEGLEKHRCAVPPGGAA